MKPQLTWDKEADAIYIRLDEGEYSHGEDLDTERRVDFDAKGRAIGVELLCVSDGVNLESLPERALIERLLDERGVRVFA